MNSTATTSSRRIDRLHPLKLTPTSEDILRKGLTDNQKVSYLEYPTFAKNVLSLFQAKLEGVMITADAKAHINDSPQSLFKFLKKVIEDNTNKKTEINSLACLIRAVREGVPRKESKGHVKESERLTKIDTKEPLDFSTPLNDQLTCYLKNHKDYKQVEGKVSKPWIESANKAKSPSSSPKLPSTTVSPSTTASPSTTVSPTLVSQTQTKIHLPNTPHENYLNLGDVADAQTLKDEMKKLEYKHVNKWACVNASQENMINGGHQEGAVKLFAKDGKSGFDDSFLTPLKTNKYDLWTANTTGTDVTKDNKSGIGTDRWENGIGRAFIVEGDTLVGYNNNKINVIATVSPTKVEKGNDSFNNLKRSWLATLECAVNNEVQGLVLTNLGAGIFGGNPQDCADSLTEVLKENDKFQTLTLLYNGFYDKYGNKLKI
ncbi:hypothetical protein DID78_05825 [Candidatus Marinamargulisbacteria bacterium SCGC AG-343-D04]|nr:hypothetical protein DID78_05825 [Candidatus Marinamargulisbacteria bacterium SCGC AG-343-D04]